MFLEKHRILFSVEAIDATVPCFIYRLVSSFDFNVSKSFAVMQKELSKFDYRQCRNKGRKNMLGLRMKKGFTLAELLIVVAIRSTGCGCDPYFQQESRESKRGHLHGQPALSLRTGLR